jgi:dTMP kinase
MAKAKKNTGSAKKKNGFLISFEGSEGAGKTTQISLLSCRLEKAGYEVVVTREPGGTPIGEDIRHLLQHSDSNAAMFSETELLLFAASRAQLVREVIIPNINKGIVVLCDRFLDSTTVYQGVAREMADDPVQMINRFAVGDIIPDLTVVIDVPAKVGLTRVKHRVSDMPDRMERENIEFYESVRDGYIVLAKSLPERFLVFDGTKSRENIESEIWDAVKDRFMID